MAGPRKRRVTRSAPGGEATRESEPPRVGIKDVAERTGLSSCTVSRILSGRTGKAKYRAATVNRVRAAARELGYRPNMVARALAEGRTWTIGLCVADIATALFGAFASHVERSASERGYQTLICNAGEDPELERRHAELLVARRVAALIISPLGDALAPLLEQAVENGTRVILFDRDLGEGPFDRVTVDNREAMRALTGRCLEAGHRSVGLIEGHPLDSSLAARREGVLEALRDRGMDPAWHLVCAGGAPPVTTCEAGRRGAAELLDRPGTPSLLLALAEPLAQGALMELRARGLVPGREISLAGFDDFAAARLIDPPLTVIEQPVERMAQACAELACDAARNAPPRTIRLPSVLHWRGSVVAPAPD